MQMFKNPWSKGESLFAYIEKNINKEGIFTSPTLPDGIFYSTDPTATLALGTADAYYAMSSSEDNPEAVETVFNALLDFANMPSELTQKKLFDAVSTNQCISYCETLIERLDELDLPFHVFTLVNTWLHEAPNREAVKFALIICGYFNVEETEAQETLHLHEDLRTLALCEEFTFFVIFAYNLSNMDTESELWELLAKTNGWGKVHVLESLDYDTPPKKDWLLRHGSEISVKYFAISLLCIREGNMLSTLQRPIIDLELYHGCLNTLNHYLEFLLDHDKQTDENLSLLNSFALCQELLRHAKVFGTSIEEMVGIINLTNSLDDLIHNNHWEVLNANQCHLLLSAAEAILYRKDWRPEIEAKLHREDGSLNYLIADFAYALEIDIWDILFQELEAQPAEGELYNYLLFTEDPLRHQQALAFAHNHLSLYIDQENGFLGILKALHHNPGTGEEFIIAALTSLYDLPRAEAIALLEDWGFNYLTPNIKAALHQAARLSQHTILTLRINALLKAELFDLKNVLHLIAEVGPK